MGFKKSLVYGVGVNDAVTSTKKNSNGRMVTCHFYKKWQSMIRRYREVCDEWLTFSNFKRWMEQQDWKGKELSKDILVKGSKVYSPETCVFVDPLTSGFATDFAASIGVTYRKDRGKFVARCSNPFSRVREYLGYFDTSEEAHAAWKKRKHELACQLAELQTDARAAAALRVRYL
jgi:hypothetical protein